MAAARAPGAAAEVSLGLALLNANGLFTREGELNPAWRALSHDLARRQFRVLVLTEPKLQRGQDLPSSDNFRVVAAPPDEVREGRRDCVILGDPALDIWGVPSRHSDICGACLNTTGGLSLLVAFYAPDSSRG